MVWKGGDDQSADPKAFHKRVDFYINLNRWQESQNKKPRKGELSWQLTKFH
jgi:hypothetical protein